jgi:hypothetical protein
LQVEKVELLNRTTIVFWATLAHTKSLKSIFWGIILAKELPAKLYKAEISLLL